MVVKERDEELALFLKLRRSEQENEINGGNLIASSDEVEAPLGLNPLGSPMSKTIAAAPTTKDEFLDLENDQADFDWLLSPPLNTLFPPLKSDKNCLMTKPDRATALTFLEENVDIELAASKKRQVSKISCLPSKPKSPCDASVQKRSTSVDPLTSTRRRASTPTGRRPVLAAAASTNKQPSRSSMPSRTTWPCTKLVGPTARSSTPTQRLTSKPSVPPVRSSSAIKSRSTVSKTMLLPPPCDSTKNSNMKAPSKERPVSASKVRPNSQSLVAEASSRRRTSSGSSERSLLIRSRRRPNSSDDVNPVIMGTKMVERIVNMRKLAPPKQDSYHEAVQNHPAGKFDKSGFGRSLSKKSLDMAMRHMDISGSVAGNLLSLRLGSRKYHKSDVSESPLATNASSDQSAHQH